MLLFLFCFVIVDVTERSLTKTICIMYKYVHYRFIRIIYNYEDILTKAEIISAAFRVWGRNLYRKTSLSKLAGELKVSKPALYRHFASKKALTAAMTEHFLDDFANSVKSDFEQALKTSDVDDGVSTIIRCISSYFNQNVYALIFSLINIYDQNLNKYTISDSLKSRGADMGTLQAVLEKKYNCDQPLLRLIFATLTFKMMYFHKSNEAMEKPLSENEVQKINSIINQTIKYGLGYSNGKADINFQKLEKYVDESKLDSEPEMFFKAVAEAVAQAGPWDVTMEMVAKKLGMSKSSLYGHYKNKKDMLRRLFMSEFKRIIAFACLGIKFSANGAEQLYLGIYSIAVYLRSRPEILITLDWIRMRKLDLGKPEKKIEFFRLFEDIDIEPIRDAPEDDKQRVSHWIIFLLINILTHPIEETGKIPDSHTQNNCIRLLYRFITLGLGGFIR